MTQWSKINDLNIVEKIAIGNDSISKENQHSWLIENLGGRWIETCEFTEKGINIKGGAPLRKNYGKVGFYYDESRDAFIPPKPFESWSLNEETCIWDPPIPLPDQNTYEWLENTQSWKLIREN